MDFIKFNEQRDFGQIMNATFSFISQEFKTLFKSILFFAGPLLLIGVLLYGMAQYGFMQLTNTSKYDNNYTEVIPQFVYYLLGMFFLFLGMVMIVTVINSYIKTYQKEKRGKFTIDDIWKETKSNFLKIAISYFLLNIIFVIIGVLGVLFLEVPLIYVMVVTAFVFSVQVHENKGFIDAMSRGAFLIKDRWFMTFGLLLISMLVVSFITYALAIPGIIIAGVISGFSTAGNIDPAIISLITIFFTSIFTLFYYFLYGIIHILVNFQYFNMIEQKEYPSLRAEIKLINQNEDSSV